MANYLVTGGAGFIGSNLVHALLSRGDAVRVVDNLSTGRWSNLEAVESRIDFVEGDLRDPDCCRKAVSDMDYVLHQAAVPSVPRSVADPLLSHETNATATMNLLIAARDAGIRRLVFAGSSSAYGNQPVEYKSEDLQSQPRSPYAAAKVACEHYLRAFAECYGLETVTLRYFNVFGPQQDPDSPYSAVIPRFIKALLHGERPVIYGDGSQARDFTYVENNVLANIAAATLPINAVGQVYNIACGSAMSIRQLFDKIQGILATDIEPIFEAPRAGDVYLSAADITRAREDLNYRVAVPFEEGLRKTVGWYAREHASGKLQ